MNKNILQETNSSPVGMDASQQAEQTLERVKKVKAMRETRKANIVEKFNEQSQINSKLSKEVASLTEELKKANEQIELVKSQASEKSAAQQAEHEAELSRHRQNAAKLHEQLRQANEEISRQRTLQSDTEEKMSEAEDKIAEAERTKEAMEGRIKDIQDDAEVRVQRSVSQAQTLIDRTQKSFEVKERRLLASIRSEKDAAELAQEDADKRIANMAKQLEEERAIRVNLEEDQQCMRHENERLGALLKRLQSTVDALLNEEFTLASEFEEAHRDLEEAEKISSDRASSSSFLDASNVGSFEAVTACARGDE
ncbi:hypothetical protein [Sulfitobacter sp. R18_1]|uniref:hypothetical protein n=1 Tax=Sulfitobacter sp. R18_1 TaxID=2821104 RepID=UPI001ADD01EA|nr:hypothetical protein [Sulfitobacter sp. R18_1]MBO9428512.1 hypothetical protein [Sulfitobacter sp. R18_1]